MFETVVRLPLMVGNRNEGLQPLRDLDNVRSFLGSMGPGAFFDLPWLPFYLAICFAFHWLLGITALVGAIILVTLTLITEFMSRTPAREAMTLAARRNDLAATSRRNAEVLVAMGMSGRLTKRWSEANESYLAGNQRASDVAGGLGAVAKVLRMMLQSAVLAVGAYLVIHQEATAGIIIAGSILSARALAPVDLAIAHWKGFVAARQSWHRLNKLLQQMPASRDADPAAEPVEAAVGRGRHASCRPATSGSSCRTSPSRSRPAAASASSVRADRASRRWCARWSASGRRSAARCGSTARRSTSGRPTCSAVMSAICRRTSNCSPARWRRTSAVSIPTPNRKRSSPPPRKPACTT